MLNRSPSNTSNTINAYRKRRRQKGPFLMYGAIALVIIGFILLVVWLTRPDQPLGQIFATETPTPTATFTPTTTPLPTETPTTTETPTATVTGTPAEDFPYTVQEGESLVSIADKFNLGDDGVLLIYYKNLADMEANNGIIFVGQTITIPKPGSVLDTSTPIPGNLPRGSKVEYHVLPGDTLAGIAVKFNSKQEDILTANPSIGEDINALQVNQVLQIPVNLITPTATLSPSSTPITPTVAGGQPAATSTASSGISNTPSQTVSCNFQENATFVNQLQTLINNRRTSNNLPALNVNAQLADIAKDHATEMLCNNYVSHTGLDGSTPEQRVSAAGFSASNVFEFLYAAPPPGGDPQAAIDWWSSNADTQADLLNPDVTIIGVAYVSSNGSLLGGYYVVLEAKQ